MNIGYLSNYRLITLQVIRAFVTSISRAFQTTPHYDFRAFDIRSLKYMPLIVYSCIFNQMDFLYFKRLSSDIVSFSLVD